MPGSLAAADRRVPDGQCVSFGQAAAWHSGERVLSPPMHAAFRLRRRHCNCCGRRPVFFGALCGILHLLPRVLQVLHHPCAAFDMSASMAAPTSLQRLTRACRPCAVLYAKSICPMSHDG
jgi:hypothetical protein